MAKHMISNTGEENPYTTARVEELLDKIKTLISNSKVDKATGIIHYLEDERKLSPNDNIRLSLLKIKILSFQDKKKEAYEKTEEILKKAKNANYHALVVEILKEQARMLLSRFEYETLLKKLDEIKEYIETFEKKLHKLEKIESNVFIQNGKGLYNWQKGDFDEALTVFSKALELAEKLENNDVMRGHISNNLGLVYYDKGDFQEALRHFKQALIYYSSMEENLAVSRSLNNIGFIYKELGDFDQALNYFQRAYEIRKKIGNKREIARVLDNIGEIHMIQGRFEKAEEIFDECLKYSRAANDILELAWIYDLLGQLYKRKGEYREALSYYNLSMQYNKDIEQKWAIAKNLMLISEIYLEQGEIELALECCDQSLEFFEQAENKLRIGQAKHRLAKINFERKDYETTELLLNECLELFNEVGNINESVKVLFDLVYYYLKQNRIEKASNYIHILQKTIKHTKEQEYGRFLYKLANSMYLKSQNRLSSKAKAQEQLLKLESSKIVQSDQTLSTVILLELLDSLVEEYELMRNEDIYEELEKKLNKLKAWAQNEDSKKLEIEGKLVKAKIAFLKKETEKAHKLIKDILTTCENHGLLRLMEETLNLMSKIEATTTEKSAEEETELISQDEPAKKEIIPQLHVLAYKWDELGFFPFVEFGDLELSEISKQKYGTFVSIATSLGSEYRSGLFGPLPFAEHKDMESIVYAQMVTDNSCMDYRLENKNYLLVTIVYPKSLEKRMIIMRDQIKNICSEMFPPETEIATITTEHIIFFVTQIKQLLNTG
ncbi:MAG: tetratricopeptide repeat protein [Candidatus Heimdallarchaeaceae archaeon]